MTKLVIDPGLFEIDPFASKAHQFEHFMFLKTSIDFVAEFLDVYVDQYDGAPYSGNSDNLPFAPPITRSLVIRNNYSELSKKIRRMVVRGQWLTSLDKSISDCTMIFENASAAEKRFKQYMCFVLSAGTYEKSLLLLSKKNSSCSPIASFFIDNSTYTLSAVCNPAIDCNGLVHEYLKDEMDSDLIFPQKAACHCLNAVFLEEKEAGSYSPDQLQAIYSKYGAEVAMRNKYHRKADISRKNPSCEVFVHNGGTYFLSIDKEHGALELFKKQGNRAIHQGEFNFSCIPSKAPDPETHKLVI